MKLLSQRNARGGMQVTIYPSPKGQHLLHCYHSIPTPHDCTTASYHHPSKTKYLHIIITSIMPVTKRTSDYPSAGNVWGGWKNIKVRKFKNSWKCIKFKLKTYSNNHKRRKVAHNSVPNVNLFKPFKVSTAIQRALFSVFSAAPDFLTSKKSKPHHSGPPVACPVKATGGG